MHRDEIHSKLVQIMRERLLVHLRGLPQIVESWKRPEDSDTQPSQFARSINKVQAISSEPESCSPFLFLFFLVFVS